MVRSFHKIIPLRAAAQTQRYFLPAVLEMRRIVAIFTTIDYYQMKRPLLILTFHFSCVFSISTDTII